MSTYLGKAINPRTGRVEDATFIDDYFGRHRYGVKFADGGIFRQEHVKVPPPPEPEERSDA